MTVRISRALLDRIFAEAGASPDREICGLLFGAAAAIVEARAAVNVAADPSRRFEIDPAALFAAIRAERAGGPALVGHYHSHPTGVAEPSACDAAAAQDAGRLWLIVAGSRATLWRAVPKGSVQGAFEPVRLVVVDGNGGCA
jgi:proteasome lid subunit RPN8/RPN11